jgi:hypothetical protein
LGRLLRVEKSRIDWTALVRSNSGQVKKFEKFVASSQRKIKTLEALKQKESKISAKAIKRSGNFEIRNKNLIFMIIFYLYKKWHDLIAIFENSKLSTLFTGLSFKSRGTPIKL